MSVPNALHTPSNVVVSQASQEGNHADTENNAKSSNQEFLDQTKPQRYTSGEKEKIDAIQQQQQQQQQSLNDNNVPIEEEGAAEDGTEPEGQEETESQETPEFNNKRIVLQRFTVYNSLRTMYVVGSNAKESLFRILEICKDPNDDVNLHIIEDKNYFYTRKDMIELLNGLNESVEGGIYKIARGYGILGLIKFTKGYYLSLITKCSQVAVLGGHFIYHVDETKLIPLDTNYKRPDKYSDEERLLSIFKYLDLGKTFYFSYSYDITNTLQTNFIRQKKYAEKFNQEEWEEATASSKIHNKYHPNGINTKTTGGINSSGNSEEETFDPYGNFEHNERFVWNKLLLEPVLENKDIAIYEWFQPIIHGFVDQANISIYGKKIYITLIARRSHHFAGARFLKRGVNDRGNVANEIETEQIVTDMLVSSFHDPKYGFFSNPRFTSFVQHRGSIPLYWTQDLNRLPKPPIEINLSDPFYQSSAIHFNNLFERYGSPVVILNLIKTKEKVPRESKLNDHFVNCVKYLNQFLPEEHKLQMYSFDMSKNSKKNLDVIGPLQSIAAKSIAQIGFFHNGVNLKSTKVQKGILRTNCIDCLDRTNAAQFIICKEALYHQLSSLKLISSTTSLDYDSDLINILTEIFHDHGDTIAIQYGGSNLVNTMDSYRRINQWSSHTRDMLNSIKRIYSNSFMDSIRQEAINLFLGNYSYDPNKPKLWELQNDFYLHNNSLIENIRVKVSYQHWFNERFLNERRFLMTTDGSADHESEKVRFGSHHKLESYPDYHDNWFNECYVPRKFQSFSELFQFNMNSNARYFPSNINNDVNKKFDYSPFESRKPSLRTTKSGEVLGGGTSHPDDSRIVEEAEDLDDTNDITVSGHETTVDNNKNDSSVLKSIRPSRHSSSNYLNITNPNKIRNFLTNKIENLGYNTGNHKHDEKSLASFSESYTPLNSDDESLSDDNEIFTPQVRLEDLKLYEQTNSTLKIPTKMISNTIPNTSVHASDEDQNLYMYYTNKLVQGNDQSKVIVTENFEKFTNLDISDARTYKAYLGLDDERIYNFDAEDNYFR